MEPPVRIGFTSTIPVEMIYAIDATPVDLNNIFITHSEAPELVAQAEETGLPRNVCAWIKGLYIVGSRLRSVEKIVAVMEGDCSNTRVLMELLRDDGIDTIPFTYPTEHTYEQVKIALAKFAAQLNALPARIREVKRALDHIRCKLIELDRLTWQENRISGEENHFFLVNASDFMGNPTQFEHQLDELIYKADHRNPRTQPIRLAFLGVPPICSDLYQQIERFDGNVVFNEIQRQFSMPFHTDDIVEQYYSYTYPYDFNWRIEAIIPELKKRGIHGIIHYVQSFCHRQLEDILLRRKIKLPILTLEGELPGPLDERSKIRLQGFIRMLKDQI